MSATDIQEPLFRPVKKRKFLRKRPDQPHNESEVQADISTSATIPATLPTSEIERAISTGPSSAPLTDTGDSQDDNIQSEVLRRRKAQRARKGGIGFTPGNKSMAGRADTSLSTKATDEDLVDQKIQAISDRFVANTGQKVDIDKHMYVYFSSFCNDI